jgi:hypothetical protein
VLVLCLFVLPPGFHAAFGHADLHIFLLTFWLRSTFWHAAWQ